MINKKLDPISATFSTGFSMSTAVTYNFYVSATGGYGTYTYSYFVVDKPSNSVLATLLDTDSSGINYTDYSNRGFMDNNLAVRVYILDGIGQVAYEIMLNDGSFGSDAATLIEPYRITAQ